MSSKSSATDPNELLDLVAGVYIHRFTGATTVNIPESRSGFIITHIHDANNASQWIFYLNGNKHQRSKSSGSIGEWVKD